MSLRTHLIAPLGALTLLSTPACDTGGLTSAEMRMAVEESVATGQAESVQQDVVEITTSFTLGDAVDAALAEIEAFIKSQSPCATVTPSGDHGLVIDFGSLADACTYRGHNYAGTLTVSVALDGAAAIVTHDLDGFTNGTVTVDGSAEVTWTTENRRVVSDFSFEREGRVTALTSDRTQRLLDAGQGLAGGIVVDGERAWKNDRGDFTVEIDAVELRAVDPVPQAGTYRITLPSGNSTEMTFTRVDADTIEVRVDGPRRYRVFRVNSAGAIDEQA